MAEEKNDKTAHPSSERLRSSLNVLWLALGVIVLIFSAYEVVERTWLGGASEELIYWLHLFRGVSTGILGAAVALWYMLRVGPTIFPATSSATVELQEASPPIQERLVYFSHWLIRMRWLAFLVTTILVLVVVRAFEYLDTETFLPLTALVLCLMASNFVFGFMLRRRLLVQRLPEMQVGTDLLILTGMLHFSGGIENPLFFAYIFHVIVGGIFLDERRCYAIVFVACGLFAVMALAEMSDFVEHYTLMVFPHGTPSEDGEHVLHAAHDVTYVASMIALQFVLLGLTAQFVLIIMKQLRAEETQRLELVQRLERVFQATGVGLIGLGEDMKPLWANAQLRNWLNLSDTDLRQPCSRIAQWTGGRDGMAAWTFNDGKTRSSDRELVDAQGNKHFFHTTVSAVTNPAGKIYEVVELTQDITEHKMLEAEAMNAKRMALLGTLAAGIAHEVGNPLASMSTQLRLLERNRSEAYVKEAHQLIQQQIDRLSLIVRDISQFARPAQKKRAICQINTVLGQAVTLIKFHRQTRRMTINTTLDRTLPDTMAVKDELMQVFLNLGFNAVEAMTGGGTLNIRTSVQQGEILVEFLDTGPGISEEARTRIFEPFFSSKEDGLGLGLSIAHKIVTLHGGHIEARNNAGGGALFSMILPIRNTL
ncbi:MAG: ATP-binding protein [Candidatus Hydrogenedentes bacterium]|nr:ATP-binding protein [Candidatus Hydrogenedentota bacterium]